MNLLSVFFDRVYINVGDMYDDYNFNIDMQYLLNEVAKANPAGEDKPLYDSNTGKVYLGRTKRFVVRKVNMFIFDLLETQDPDENMAAFASIKQLERLIQASDSENKHISCYGLVYLYIIYTLLEGKSDASEQCAAYVTAMDELISDYFVYNRDDQLAEFFHGCYEPIIQAIREHNCCLDKQELPPRPRRHPKESLEW